MKKILLFSAAALVFTSSAIAIGENKAFAVKAEDVTSDGDSSIVSSASSDSSTSENTDVDQLKEEVDYWKSLYNTYIVPLLGGCSITTLIAAVIGIWTSISKRKSDKKFSTTYDSLITKALEALSVSAKMVETVKAKEEVDEATMKEFTAKADSLIAEIATLSGNVEKLEQLKSIVKQLTLIEGKIASNTKELVACGVAEDIDDLLDQIDEVTKNE